MCVTDDDVLVRGLLLIGMWYVAFETLVVWLFTIGCMCDDVLVIGVLVFCT